jgi:hypothetical protein
MEKTYQKISLKQQSNDFNYWQTQTYQQRLQALEEIRQEYHQWKYKNVESRLQRIYTVSQR